MKRPLVLLITLFLLALGGSTLAILDHERRSSRGPEMAGREAEAGKETRTAGDVAVAGGVSANGQAEDERKTAEPITSTGQRAGEPTEELTTAERSDAPAFSPPVTATTAPRPVNPEIVLTPAFGPEHERSTASKAVSAQSAADSSFLSIDRDTTRAATNLTLVQPRQRRYRTGTAPQADASQEGFRAETNGISDEQADVDPTTSRQTAASGRVTSPPSRAGRDGRKLALFPHAGSLAASAGAFLPRPRTDDSSRTANAAKPKPDLTPVDKPNVTSGQLALVPPSVHTIQSTATDGSEATEDARDQSAPGTNATAPATSGALVPTFDIVRVEPTGEAVIAGHAAPGASIEIRANNEVVAQTQAEANGAWVAVPDAPLAPGSYDLSLHAEGMDGATQTSHERVAMAVPETRDGGVLVVISKIGAARQVLTAPSSAGAPRPLDIAGGGAVAEPGAIAVAQAGAVPALTIEAVEAEDGRLYVAGASKPGRRVRVYIDDIHVGDADAGPGGRWLLESQDDLPSRRLTLTIRADALHAGDDRVEARAQVPFVRRLDAAALVPAVAVAAGSTIELAAGPLPEPNALLIRRGDNLWTISRRAYGRGIRYTTIFGANSEQIRNPNRIYPGQVFVMPTSDRSWTE